MERVYRVAPPCVLPDISPTGGEIGWKRHFPQQLSIVIVATVREGAMVKLLANLHPCGGDARQDTGGCPEHCL
ncbi:hypothetical protein ATY78_13905 [Rhizobium sp. R635]|nr:hypothetical protein ATY78_13905 [Rhizobium sp. R635]